MPIRRPDPPPAFAGRPPIPGLGHSSPIVWGDRVFVATAVRESGEPPLRLGLFGDSTGADDNVHQRWVIYCLDAKDGRIVWEQIVKTGTPRGESCMATPALSRGQLIVRTRSQLVAIA